MSLIAQLTWLRLVCCSILFFVLLPASTLADSSAVRLLPGDNRFQLPLNGISREYLLHTPADFDPAKQYPLVMMFHGGGGKARGAMRETGWSEKADAEKFLVAYPEGSRAHPRRRASFIGNPQTWNDGSNRSKVGAVERQVDDIAFVRALLADLKTRCAIDPQRIYATGFSNGASMAFRVGRELSSLFAAIGPVSGSDWLPDRNPSEPLSLIYITGTTDRQNPLEGGEITLAGGHFGRKPAVAAFISQWREQLHCPRDSQTLPEHESVHGLTYAPCERGTEIQFYTVDGMGHSWPGGTNLLPEFLVGSSSEALKATDVIWEFFKRHPKQPTARADSKTHD